MSGEHAHAASLFSPQSKFKVEYSAVVDVPKNIHRFNESTGTEKKRSDVGRKRGGGTLPKKQRREAAPDNPSSSSGDSDYSSDSDGETRGATHGELL